MKGLMITEGAGIKRMTSMEISDLVEKLHDKGKKRAGYLYLIESLCKKRIKTGRSVRPSQRVAEITTIVGGVGRVFISGLVLDAVAVESAFHKALAAKRTTGEWFSCGFTDVVEEVQGVCQRFAATQQDIEEKRLHREAVADRAFRGILKHFGVTV